MGFYPPGTPPSPHLYPQELQLKLYQAFIFSIPILFTIILVLLFYLFYLKRRASTLSSSQHFLPTTTTNSSSNQSAPHLSSSGCQVGLKEKLSEKLQVVLFDEELRSKESQCCVCLGEFETKEELLQISSCRHVFHMDCIRHWLLNNSTCPLCRCFVIPTPTINKHLNHNHNHNHNNVPPPSQSRTVTPPAPAMVVPQQSMARSEVQVVDINNTHVEPQEEEEAVATTSSVEHHSMIRIVEGSSSNTQL